MMAKVYNFSLQKVLDVRKHVEVQGVHMQRMSRSILGTEMHKLNKLNQNKEKVLKKYYN